MTDSDSEDVYLKPASSRNSSATPFHLTEDCPRGPSNPVRWSRANAEAQGYHVCPFCDPEQDDPSNNHSSNEPLKYQRAIQAHVLEERGENIFADRGGPRDETGSFTSDE
jgi:hypothetical protein